MSNNFIVGYADKWSVKPGDTIAFKVSCNSGSNYDSEIVRLRQPEIDSESDLLPPITIPADCNKMHLGRLQEIRCGSYISFPSKLTIEGNFTLSAYVRPTLTGTGRQAILGTLAGDGTSGFGLEITPLGNLALVIAISGGKQVRLVNISRLKNIWYWVGATFNKTKGEAEIWQKPLEMQGYEGIGEERQRAPTPFLADLVFSNQKLTIGAWVQDDAPQSFFNGCIERPRLTRSYLEYEAQRLLNDSPMHESLQESLIGAWDFAKGISTDIAFDLSKNDFHGTVINQPTRAVPGHNWTPDCAQWIKEPEYYGAIHFHEDDLIDAHWESDFVFNVPPELQSGIYAAVLTQGKFKYHIPFVVLPSKQRKDTVMVLPTATYIAYQNHRGRFKSSANERLHGRLNILDLVDVMFVEHPELGLSTYDVHKDGSGVIYSSSHRPASNIRPTGRLWNFNTDLLIVQWLEHLGKAYDVITDEELHRCGYASISEYKVVITGSHPEYASTEMVDAIQSYVSKGGRLMYLGGNGYYWRIAFHPTRSGIIEVRRCEGVRSWQSAPGAYFCSFTGERSGLWRNNGRAPQSIVGIGFVAQGFDQSSYYRRTADSYADSISWAFSGISDEIIGDFGHLQGGAAGIEIDATDESLGTPQTTIILARSERHSNTYELAGEEVLTPHGATDAILENRIRSEIVLLFTHRGGAIFSVGSIAYAGSLNWNFFDNNIAKLTENILYKFVDSSVLEM